MKRTWKKLFAFVCAFTLVAAPVTYNTVNAVAPDSNSNGAQIGNASIGNNSTTSSNNASVGTDYTLTIPATLNVANAGWNATDGITAKGTLESGKKLVVTPISENSWNLVANKGEETESKVGYNLAKETGTYSAEAEAPTWEFTELTADGTSQTAGIIVDDYSTKPAGTYTDTVTFTASVENAVTTRTVTWTGQTLMDHSVYGEYRDGFTTEGVTLTTEGNSNQDVRSGNYFYGRNYNSFSVSDGKKFTKIVIESEGEKCELNDFPSATVTSHVLTEDEILEKYPYYSEHPDWLYDMVGTFRTDTITWTGNAETVRFKAWISPVSKITFTIE